MAAFAMMLVIQRLIGLVVPPAGSKHAAPAQAA
jgi:hypothetical protein